MNLKHKMFLSKMQKKIFLVYLFIILIFAGFIIIFYNYLADTTRNTAIDNQLELTKKTSVQVDDFLLNMDKTALQVMGNDAILHAFEAKGIAAPDNYFDSNISIQTELQKNLLRIDGPSYSVGRISIYNSSSDYLSYGFYNETNSKISQSLNIIHPDKVIQEIDNQVSSKRKITIHQDYWSNDGGVMISVFRPLKNITSNKNLGLIEVQMKADQLYQLISLKKVDNIKTYIFDENGAQIYPSAVNPDITKVSKETNGNNTIEIMKDHINTETGNRELITIQRGNRYQWSTIMVQSNESLIQPIKQFVNILTLCIILALLFTLVFIFEVTKKLMAPLKQLSDSVKEVSLTNLSLKIDHVKNMDEVESVNQAFQTMFNRLQLSIENEMKSNFLALQAQMNPHFLYNVLSVISATGIERDVPEVPLLCDMLSNMLRYSSSFSDKMVSLDQEVDYAKNYLSLMQARYEDRMNFEITEDGNLHDILVPKILIQPIIENCFKHAFNEVASQWKVLLHVEVSEQLWAVEIVDNGCGISQEKITAITQRIDAVMENPSSFYDLKIGGLGLVNTIIRLKLLYGNSVFYEIKNSEGCGMLVRIGGMRN